MILITGGCGFVGHHLVNNLRDREVWVIDKQLDYVTREAHYITDEIKNIGRYGLKPDTIIHLAADSDVNSQSFDIVNQTWELLTWAKKVGVKKFIFTSSAAVYDEGKINPKSIYGLSKLTIEKLIELFGFETTILRLFNVYGPHNKKGFIYHVLNDSPIQLYVSDNHTRDFVHVYDVVETIKRALDNPPTIMDVGTGIATNLKEFAVKHTNGRKIIYNESRGIVNSRASIKPLEKMINLEEGINLDTVDYNQKQIAHLY